jgi:hypothetical protein
VVFFLFSLDRSYFAAAGFLLEAGFAFFFDSFSSSADRLR